jgi:type VI secretion system protein ImpJ
MSWHNRVIWSEGMFLRPQHFQQQDRYFDHLIRETVVIRGSNNWGVRLLELDRSLLEVGKLSIPKCQGVMPDGTLFSVPEQEDPPPVIDVGGEVRDRTVFLVTPVERAALAAAEFGQGGNGLERFEPRSVELYDTAQDSLGSKAAIDVGRMRLSMKIEGEQIDGYQGIPIARISEVGNDRRVILNEDFVPASINYRASTHLMGFLRELQGLLKQRGDALADRVSASGRGTVAEVADFLLLQIANRLEPVVGHLVTSTGLHPESLYRFYLGIAGELATFTTDARRPDPLPAYQHDALVACFAPVEAEIRRSLRWIRDPTAVSIPIEELRFGIWRATVQDRALFSGASFLLEVSADLDGEKLMRAFRDQSKIGPQDKIRDLVMHALPGVSLRTRPTAPRQIPYHAGAVYFEMDTGNEMWREIEESGVLTLHVAGTFPNLAMSLWAMKR